ncbi:MAG: exodeoxyribonuclease VII large subunit [Syntrophothermus sp.]
MIESTNKLLLSVGRLTGLIKQKLEINFNNVLVIGEVSNFKKHSSGHWYFNLKDNEAVICCAMWKSYNTSVFFNVLDGMKVIVEGRVTVYPPKGGYQIDIKVMKPAGEGELQAAFERLKQKLLAEGLFDKDIKKPIPIFPERIGIITGKGTAALKDMISVAKRRYPLAEIIIAPSKMQGAGTAANVAQCLDVFNTNAHKVDVIIIARGGGSIEDLWAFNEEVIARAIRKSRIPVVTGIGHEIDFTIADFASDLRAPTPTAAMELITPDVNEIYSFLKNYQKKAGNCIDNHIDKNKKEVTDFIQSYGFRTVLDVVRIKEQSLDGLIYKIDKNIDNIMFRNKSELEILYKSLAAHDVTKILEKGFVLVKQNSKFITRAKNFDASSSTELVFKDGEIRLPELELKKENTSDEQKN